jgi:hypothetical protein
VIALALVPGVLSNYGDQPQIDLARYTRAVAHYGSSPALSPGELTVADEADRAAVDGAMLRMLSPVDRPLPALPAGAACRSAPGGDTPVPEETHGADVFVLAGEGPVVARVRRFGAGLPADPLLSVPAHSRSLLRLPLGRLPQPWVIELRSAEPFRVCEP